MPQEAAEGKCGSDLCEEQDTSGDSYSEIVKDDTGLLGLFSKNIMELLSVLIPFISQQFANTNNLFIKDQVVFFFFFLIRL